MLPSTNQGDFHLLHAPPILIKQKQSFAYLMHTERRESFKRSLLSDLGPTSLEEAPTGFFPSAITRTLPMPLIVHFLTANMHEVIVALSTVGHPCGHICRENLLALG